MRTLTLISFFLLSFYANAQLTCNGLTYSEIDKIVTSSKGNFHLVEDEYTDEGRSLVYSNSDFTAFALYIISTSSGRCYITSIIQKIDKLPNVLSFFNSSKYIKIKPFEYVDSQGENKYVIIVDEDSGNVIVRVTDI